MGKFFEDDIVICVKNINNMGNIIQGITIGEVYTIRKIDGSFIELLNDSKNFKWYSEARFTSKEDYREQIINGILYE